MLIRPETVADYAAIADLHARAFGNRAGEPLIVALHRQRAVFDPDLSLVAEERGRIVGHALFSPHVMRLLGQEVRAVNLAPFAVEPARQGQGIGGRLLAAGHEAAAAKGYQLSFLLGHPSYYPRFGYRTRAYGTARARVVAALSPPELQRRPPAPEDVPALLDLWRRDEGAVDFALQPGAALLDWLSPHPAIEATVYLLGGEVVGYTRVHRDEPSRPRVFLAAGPDAARRLAGALAWRAEPPLAELVLPIHPRSVSGQAFPATVEAREAAMARGLGPGPLDDYLARVEAGGRPPGRPTWPVAFDLG